MGRSTIDPVWRHAVKGQFRASVGDQVAALGWDMRKFYERMDHHRLEEEAKALNFNKTIIDVATNAYRTPRTITYNKHAAKPLNATRGIVSGDSLSDS